MIRKYEFRRNPVDTRRRFSVYKTSIPRCRRRIDILKTLKRHRVSIGNENIVSRKLYANIDDKILSSLLSTYQ